MELKTPSGFTIYFKEKISYGDYLKYQQIILGDVEVEAGKPMDTLSLKASQMIFAKDKAIEFFVTRVTDKEGKEVPNPADFVRNLSSDEAGEIDSALDKLLGENLLSKKKQTP